MSITKITVGSLLLAVSLSSGCKSRTYNDPSSTKGFRATGGEVDKSLEDSRLAKTSFYMTGSKTKGWQNVVLFVCDESAFLYAGNGIFNADIHLPMKKIKTEGDTTTWQLKDNTKDKVTLELTLSETTKKMKMLEYFDASFDAGKETNEVKQTFTSASKTPASSLFIRGLKDRIDNLCAGAELFTPERVAFGVERDPEFLAPKSEPVAVDKNLACTKEGDTPNTELWGDISAEKNGSCEAWRNGDRSGPDSSFRDTKANCTGEMFESKKGFILSRGHHICFDGVSKP